MLFFLSNKGVQFPAGLGYSYEGNVEFIFTYSPTPVQSHRGLSLGEMWGARALGGAPTALLFFFLPGVDQCGVNTSVRGKFLPERSGFRGEYGFVPK